MYKTLLVSLALLSLAACKNDHKKGPVAYPVRYSTAGRYLVKETDDLQGNLLRKQLFNSDTVADGPMTDYFPDGKISVWRFFKPASKAPVCGLFYKKDGSLDMLKGTIILDAIRFPGNNINVKFPNPPQLSFIIKYRDYYKDKVVSEKDYEPLLTDSCCWIGLSNHKVQPDHVYKFALCVVDTAKHKILDMYSEQLQMADNGE